MNELDFLRAQVAREHGNLLAILESPRTGASAAYLLFAIRRALSRDRAHAARLETRILPGDAAAIEAIAALRSGFAERERSLAALEDALAPRLPEESGQIGRLVAAIDAAAQAHGGLAERWAALEPTLLHHYLIEDWRSTTLIDADSVLEERTLHAAWVRATGS